MKFVITLIAALTLSTSAFSQCGTASHYGHGDGFHGRRTASGTIFNKHAMTAAHRHLPFGTRLRVVHSSGRSVNVVITDRGPFVHGRILDLSSGAARALGMGGTGKVCF
jgi:rare lipoprotein A